MGGVHPLHHGSAQDSDHHRVALPAVQLSLGGFRRNGQPHEAHHRAGRNRGERRSAGVLAQAGEGSVRDSLSALDQAIACCGSTLRVEDVRELLGVFDVDSLRAVADAVQRQDGAAMLEIVQELERNGQSLQHFSRELARYWRNLLVAKIAGKPTRLIAASDHDQQRLLETAKAFSEEDLTRYLQPHAGTVQGAAIFPAAAAAPGTRIDQAGAGKPAAAYRRSPGQPGASGTRAPFSGAAIRRYPRGQSAARRISSSSESSAGAAFHSRGEGEQRRSAAGFARCAGRGGTELYGGCRSERADIFERYGGPDTGAQKHDAGVEGAAAICYRFSSCRPNRAAEIRSGRKS